MPARLASPTILRTAESRTFILEGESDSMPVRHSINKDRESGRLADLSKNPAMTIYRIHVSLLNIQPTIWRRVELSSHTTLKQFHRILQIVMGWENYHLHEFLVDNQRYGVPDPEFDQPGDVIGENKVHLSGILPRRGTQIRYTYDFGDNWQHALNLEEIVPVQSEIEYPRVLDGARSCPPEDCGGNSGYANLLDILTDPEHEDYQHMRGWAGERFNAEVFSLKDINLRLRRNRSLSPKP
jgi:Plasmid pRiA4b ORF-3-like protein